MIYSIAIGADYSYEVKNNEIWVPAFFKHNNSFIATVFSVTTNAKPFEGLDFLYLILYATLYHLDFRLHTVK